MICWVNILNDIPTDKKEAKKQQNPRFWAWIYDHNIYTPYFDTREECLRHCVALLKQNMPKEAKQVKNPDKCGEWVQIDF